MKRLIASAVFVAGCGFMVQTKAGVDELGDKQRELAKQEREFKTQIYWQQVWLQCYTEQYLNCLNNAVNFLDFCKPIGNIGPECRAQSEQFCNEFVQQQKETVNENANNP